MMTDYEYLLGPCVLGLTAVTYNILAARRGMPTISQGVRRTAASPYGVILVGAVTGGIIAHWFLDKGE